MAADGHAPFLVELATDRLRLERLCRERVDPVAVHDHFCSDTVREELRFLPRSPHETVAETRDFIVDAEEDWDAGGRACYAVRNGGGTFIGTAALHVRRERRSGFLVVWLRKPHWGQGYARECVDALVEFAFDAIDLEMVALSHEPGNDRSKRLIERYVEASGGRYDGRLRNWVPHDDHVADLHRYSIAASEYHDG